MKIPKVLDPYMLYIKLALILLVIGSSVWFGTSIQKGWDAEMIGQKNVALTAASAELQAAANALRSQNKANKQAIADAKEAKRQADLAGQVASANKLKVAKQKKEFAQKLKEAREKPQCEAVLKMDIQKECGI